MRRIVRVGTLIEEMTHVRRTMPRIGIVTLLASVFLVTMETNAHAEAVSEPCVPAVRLEGDEPLRQKIAAVLESHGIFTGGDIGCVRVVVQVASSAEGIELHIADIQGRTAVRRVTDAETAAAVIESWALPALIGPPPTLGASGAQPVLARDPIVAARPVAPERGFAIGMWLGPSWGQDRSLWGDLTVVGCGRIGPVCLGGALIATLDFTTSGESASTDTDRRGFEVLSAVDFPITSGRFAVMPGVALGLGWLRLSVDDDNPNLAPGELVSADSWSLRTGAYLRAAVEITSQIRLGISVMFEFVPIASEVSLQSSSGPVEFASPPAWFLRGAIGIQFDTF